MADLRIESLELVDYRNYEAFSLDGVGGLTVLVGRNAIGKTNILEAIQLLTSASSFRHAQVAQLVRDGSPHGRIALHAGDGNRRLDVSLTLEPGKRRYMVNGKPKHAADVRGVLPSVAFTPDDLQLAKKSSSVKRDALDDLGMQLTRNYHVVRRDYEKTIRYKNRLLKDEASDALVESINETLVTCGSQLFCYRVRLFSRIIDHISRIYGQLAASERGSEVFEASYLPSWERVNTAEGAPGTTLEGGAASLAADVHAVRERLAAELSRHVGDERRRGKSLIGPHNDGITFFLDARDASQFASQGQQRSIVLSWKLAEVELVREILGVKPVLLLDDVLSELDGQRREMLVRFVTDDIQTFVTATDLDGFSPELLDRARVVQLPL